MLRETTQVRIMLRALKNGIETPHKTVPPIISTFVAKSVNNYNLNFQ